MIMRMCEEADTGRLVWCSTPQRDLPAFTRFFGLPFILASAMNVKKIHKLLNGAGSRNESRETK